MQWLYDILHVAWVATSTFFGQVYWLFKTFFLIRIMVIASVFSVSVFMWRMIAYSFTVIISHAHTIAVAVATPQGQATVGTLLDLANYIFPIEESLALMALLATYACDCLFIRFCRAFIPTMT
jgi:hypothetical protein